MHSRWISRFLSLADAIAQWSKDPTTKVGCLIIDQARTIRATGYNGFPRSVTDARARLDDRATKHRFTVHAEANAVAAAARAGTSLRGCTAIITHPCCSQCAALLAQAGITAVYYRNRPLADEWLESLHTACAIFDEAAVRYAGINDPQQEIPSP